MIHRTGGALGTFGAQRGRLNGMAAVAAVCGLLALGCDGIAEPPLPPAPTLTALTPNAGNRAATVRVALTGTEFHHAINSIQVSGSGVTVNDFRWHSPTSVDAEFIISASAATGGREVTLTTPGGSSAALPFTVRLATPTLASIAPSVGVRGTTTAVTLTGTDFVTGATTVAVSGSGIAVSGVNVANSTSLTANLVIDAGAAIGDRTVTVTTVSGASGARTFTVNPQTPTLTAVSPAIGVRGTTVAMTLTGTNFVTGATTVAVSGSDVTVSNVSVAGATSLTADFAVGSSAALGARTVTVTTAGGTSGTQTFTVNPPAPTLTAVSPTTGVQGNTVAVTLTGTNFVAGATVGVSGSNVTVSNVTVASGTSLTADFAIASGAALGDRDVTVTTSGGTTAAKTFTVNPPAPTLTAVSPTNGVQGTTVSVTLTGTNFVSGSTTVAVSGSGVTVQNVSVSSGTSLTASFVIGSTAATGARTVTVTTAGGTSGTQTFTVNPSAEPQEIPVQPSRLPLTPG